MAEKKATKLSNGQRKAIAAAKDAQLEMLLKKGRAALDARRKELLEQVMEEFGIELCHSMIEEYDGYLASNKARLRDHGMEWHRKGIVKPEGKVDSRLKELTGEYIRKVEDLELMRTTLAQEVWEAETTADLPELPE